VETKSGTATMQIAAKTNLILIDFPSNADLANEASAITEGKTSSRFLLAE
jgi:hypothetical protein